jgi:hypothetical protein
MRTVLKLLIFAATSSTALALAGAALAAYTSPTIRVDNPSERISGPASPVAVHLTVDRGDDPTAVIDVFIPQGYTGNLTPAPGTQIGTATVRAQSLASPDVIVPLEGVLQVGELSTFTSQARLCFANPAPNVQAVWVVQAPNPTGGNPVVVPMYLTTSLSQAEGAAGQARLRVCLPFPGTGQLTAKVFEAHLRLTNLLTNPAAAGSYRWVARFTPYLGPGAPNLPGTVEAQALDTIPVRLNIRAGRYNRRTKLLAVSGTIVEAGTPLRVFVNVLLNGRRVARVRSNENGVYRTTIRIRRTGRYTLRATSAAPARTVTGCTAVLTPAVPCTRAVVSGFAVTSSNTRVRIR